MVPSTSPAASSQSSRFVRLARVCNRHRWRTFGVWLLALVVIQVIASSVGVKQISSFRLPGTESQRAYDLLAQHFPAAKGDTDQLVFKARTGTLKDPAIKARIDARAEEGRRPVVGRRRPEPVLRRRSADQGRAHRRRQR